MISLLAATYGTVSDIEIVWTLIALFGACFSIFNLSRASGDLKVLKRARIKNGRLILARFTFRSEIARLAVQVIFVSIGIVAMLLPDPPSNLLTHTQQLFGFIVRWGLISGASLLTLKSFWAYQARIALQNMSSEKDERIEAQQVEIDAQKVEISNSKKRIPESPPR